MTFLIVRRDLSIATGRNDVEKSYNLYKENSNSLLVNYSKCERFAAIIYKLILLLGPLKSNTQNILEILRLPSDFEEAISWLLFSALVLNKDILVNWKNIEVLYAHSGIQINNFHNMNELTKLYQLVFVNKGRVQTSNFGIKF